MGSIFLRRRSISIFVGAQKKKKKISYAYSIIDFYLYVTMSRACKSVEISFRMTRVVKLSSVAKNEATLLYLNLNKSIYKFYDK